MLLERELIQSVGFRNVRENGRITGFQLRLRMPSYRGMSASLIDAIAVKVGDLVDVAADVPLWTLQGRPTRSPNCGTATACAGRLKKRR